MSDHTTDFDEQQSDLFETEAARSLLDQLLADSRLYRRSADYKGLLDFVARLRNFAPFNAMLLQLQKPGLSYAASERDWRERFERWPVEGARPLLILWPFGPVALVYDVADTEGKSLPEDASTFVAHGVVDAAQMAIFAKRIERRNIEWYSVDAGDRRAGSIRVTSRAADAKDASRYRMCINRNHSTEVQFVTLAHELAHLFLGHLGPDKKLNVPHRPPCDHTQQELEAESVAFLVCARYGVRSKSETYLTNYVATNTTVEHLDLYQVMRAAGQVEAALGLATNARH